jgi:hypothetical protein
MYPQVLSKLSAAGPSKEVLLYLTSPMAGRDAGQRFLEAARFAGSCLQEGSSGRQSVSLQKQIIDRLQDMHMCIVELDYNLDEHQSPEGVSP